ncbi:TonB-dependent receptor [Halosquirtibacter laminarini]|uniref:TonB-dependent receptor n=1 Tax=Halosquirtibacter laminarini TaxID=3374600 RepID=A0AC61NIN5_9BACT|nr:TonB-dependent receptor [Prolixibacteraceae bacterium]
MSTIPIRLTLLSVLLCFTSLMGYAQHPSKKLKGIVHDLQGKPMGGVQVIYLYKQKAVVTQDNGSFEMTLPVDTCTIEFRYFSFKKRRYLIDMQKMAYLKGVLEPLEILEVHVTGDRNASSMQRIELSSVKMMDHGPSGGVESLLKTQPGVNSRNELSNQYTVRGGNYDENLLYINGIQIYKSLLFRSGKQEGLSSINPLMVDRVQFSTGGFSAKYGDKLSSALNVSYRLNDTLKTTLKASMLGMSAHTQGTLNKFSYNIGARYKTTTYLLSDMDEKGNYEPLFYDFQGVFRYSLGEKFSLEYLFFLSRSDYSFKPESRDTRFGTLQNPLHFKIYYDGQEKDQFLNYTNALKLIWTPTSNSEVVFAGSQWIDKERIRYDIMGQYYLQKAGEQISQNISDNNNHAGVGSDFKHSNEKVDVRIDALQLDFKVFNDYHRFQAGVKFEKEYIYEDSRRWAVYDSSGYFLPDNNDVISVESTYTMKNDIDSKRYQGYITESLFFPIGGMDLAMNVGLRYQYCDYLNEGTWSPRASLNIALNDNKNLRLAWGIYQQMPFYQEFKSMNGTFVEHLSAQKSTHYIVGYSQPLGEGRRKMILSIEAYYKKLQNMIPYLLDNVYIQYLPEYVSNGYTKGIDMKLVGEFVPGVDSWISMSYLKSEEDIEGDLYGYIPRPSDERLNLNLFYQDYLPGNRLFKMRMLFYYSTGVPFYAPQAIKTDNYFRMPSYKRIDIGFSRSLTSRRMKQKGADLWVGFDIFNLFDMSNTISYYWIKDIHANQYAVPNYMTGRRFNVSMTLSF